MFGNEKPGAPSCGEETSSEWRTVTYPNLSKARTVLLVCAIASAGFLTVLNVQSVVIILPSLGEALGIPASRQQLVVSVYNVSLGSLMMLCGRLADVYGRRLVFLGGSVLFTISTLCLPFSSTEIPFYVLRVLQGMGGAAIIPAGLGIAATTLPPGKSRTRAYVVIAALGSIGSIVGNLLGGLIGGYLSWKWVFWIPAILAALTTGAAFVVTSTPELQKNAVPATENSSSSVDWLGAIMISSSLLLLLITLTEANVVGWSTPWIPPLIVASVIFLVLFIWWQRRLERGPAGQPLLRISMFRHVRYSFLFILIGCFYASFNGFIVFATYFYQDYLGLSELQATLRFLPAGISGLIVSFAVSPALSRIPGFYVLVFGLLCSIVGPLLFAIPVIDPQTTYWAYGFPAMCLCCSVEIVWPIASLLVADELPQEEQAVGGGLLQTANNVGRALGLAIATVVQTSSDNNASDEGYRGNADYLHGLRAGQWVNFGLAVAALGIAIAFFRKLGRR